MRASGASNVLSQGRGRRRRGPHPGSSANRMGAPRRHDTRRVPGILPEYSPLAAAAQQSTDPVLKAKLTKAAQNVAALGRHPDTSRWQLHRPNRAHPSPERHHPEPRRRPRPAATPRPPIPPGRPPRHHRGDPDTQGQPQCCELPNCLASS